MFLQETLSAEKHEDLWKHQWHGDMIFSHGTSGSGVSVLLLDTTRVQDSLT